MFLNQEQDKCLRRWMEENVKIISLQLFRQTKLTEGSMEHSSILHRHCSRQPGIYISFYSWGLSSSVLGRACVWVCVCWGVCLDVCCFVSQPPVTSRVYLVVFIYTSSVLSMQKVSRFVHSNKHIKVFSQIYKDIK